MNHVPVSAEYLAAQRDAFLAGYPPHDFSGGEGERAFKGRAGLEDVAGGPMSMSAMGLEPFAVKGEVTAGKKEVVAKANAWLF